MSWSISTQSGRWRNSNGRHPAGIRRCTGTAARQNASWTLLHCTCNEVAGVSPVRIGVGGLGYWGPNIARNFAAIPGCELAWCCDPSEAARQRFVEGFPDVTVTDNLEHLLSDRELDAVAVATPVPTHAELAVRVLQAGKHCFVEKPLAQSVADAERAVAAAASHERILMVGHLLEYHPGVRRLKQLSDSGELGDR